MRGLSPYPSIQDIELGQVCAVTARLRSAVLGFDHQHIGPEVRFHQEELYICAPEHILFSVIPSPLLLLGTSNI